MNIIFWQSLRIVIITSIVVAAIAAAVRDKFDKYSHIGGIVGSSVSAGFLIILGIINVFILYKLIKDLNKAIKTYPSQHRDFKITGAGCLLNLFKKMFKLIGKWSLDSWTPSETNYSVLYGSWYKDTRSRCRVRTPGVFFIFSFHFRYTAFSSASLYFRVPFVFLYNIRVSYTYHLLD